jgi:hypothetical protein
LGLEVKVDEVAAGERESGWVPVGVDQLEAGCGASNEPKKANGFGRPEVELDDDGLDGVVFVPAGAAVDAVDVLIDVADVPGVTELEEAPCVVPGVGLEAGAEFDDSPSSATASPGLLAIAAPTPTATANAPTVPTNRPVDGAVANGGVLS